MTPELSSEDAGNYGFRWCPDASISAPLSLLQNEGKGRRDEVVVMIRWRHEELMMICEEKKNWHREKKEMGEVHEEGGAGKEKKISGGQL